MRLTDLINCHCVTEDGRVLGRVFEFRARKRGGKLEIQDLLLGRHALIERYGAGRHRPPPSAGVTTSCTRCRGRTWCASTAAASSSADPSEPPRLGGLPPADDGRSRQ